MKCTDTNLIGIDLGGTKTSIAVLDQYNNKIFTERLRTPSNNYIEIIATIKELVERAKAETTWNRSAAIGIGIPGELSAENETVKNANIQSIIGRTLKADLQDALDTQVVIANDATCFISSEMTDGAAATATVAFGIILGTGIGGGLGFKGNGWVGPNRIAGEWGHNPFPFFGSPNKNRQCYCGKVDCIEQILSGRAIEQDYFEIAGVSESCKNLYETWAEKKICGVQVFEEFFENLAKAIATIINVIDPDIIVVGGGLSNINEIYTEIPKRWRRYVFAADQTGAPLKTTIVKSKWGDDSGVRGAAWLTRPERNESSRCI